MGTIIIGAGEMGYYLARRLAHEKREVTLIDRHSARVEFVEENLDVQAILGRGSSPSVLRRAGIEKANILVAVTDSDEVNLVACFVAGLLNPNLTKVARLRHEDYHEYSTEAYKDHLGVDLVISPENEAVSKLLKILLIPSATDVIDFAEGRIKLFGIRLRRDSPLVGSSLTRLREEYSEDRFLIPAIFRDSEIIIPRGQDVLNTKDTVYFIAPGDTVTRLVEIAGLQSARPKTFMILGGSTVGFRIAAALEKRRANRIRLVESDRAKCEEFAALLDHTMVLHTASVDEDFLRREGISEIDAFLAMTDDDEHNALAAVFAKRMGVSWTAALAGKMEFHRLLTTIGVDVVVNPRLEGASKILQYLRKGKVVSVSMLPGEEVEAIEFEAMAGSAVVGTPLSRLKFPLGSLIGGVVREEEFLIPDGQTVIRELDRIIVFARREVIASVEKLVSPRSGYLSCILG